ncbi:MAG TPA: adenylate kinase [Candidatus Omnitrophica bacterium]|nr:adenylate kinase [Candidatus Omnitrophota bacterium]
MRLVLLGPPGAGKGTQAKVLSQDLNIPHISTGDIFRDTVKENTPLGRELAGYMQKGVLVPDDIVNRAVFERLKKEDASGGFILDGYPRTKPQAAVFDEMLKKSGMSLDIVIYMETSKNIIVKRLTGRRICSKCGANYHITNIPPKKEGVCDACGGKLIQRDDDSEQTVLKRIKIYNEQTAGLIDYYQDKGLLCKVSGDLEVDKLNRVLNEFFVKEGLL